MAKINQETPLMNIEFGTPWFATVGEALSEALFKIGPDEMPDTPDWLQDLVKRTVELA